jgi:CDP-glycerol glycerophosphotransferase
MGLFGRVKKVLRNKKNNAYKFNYLKYYNKHVILKNTILVESTHGNDFYGHVFYLCKEIVETHSEYEIFLAVTKEKREKIEQHLRDNDLLNALHLVDYNSDQYVKLLASAEYLFNDTSFFDYFIKQDFQKYVNIWHGTPLKYLGKDNGDVPAMGNVQKNFLAADKLVVSNEYTRQKLISAFNLDGIMRGSVVVAPSLRNSILRDKATRENLRKKENFSKKRILVYMPTWRGNVGKVDNTTDKITLDLKIIDKNLSDDIILYVKLHPFQEELADIKYDEFTHIRSFPKDYETYEFLSGTDGLITDYSSIMYDYLNTEKPVIIYDFDKEEYYSERGCYEDVEDYPFTNVKNVNELVDTLNGLKATPNYDKSFAKKYIEKDNLEGTKQVVDYIFDNKHTDNIDEVTPYNGKETVLICSGAMWKNGITTALINTLDNVDTAKRNYVLFFKKNRLKKEHQSVLFNLPKGVQFYPVPGGVVASMWERFLLRRYSNHEHLGLLKSNSNKVYLREFNRLFKSLNPDYFIHYTGFERAFAGMVSALKGTTTKTIMYVHTDMKLEVKLRKKGINWHMLKEAYKDSFKVVLVSEKLKKEFIKMVPNIEDKIRIVDNFLGHNRIQKMASESLYSNLIETPVIYANNVDLTNKILAKFGTPILNNTTSGNDFIMRKMTEYFYGTSLSQYLKHVSGNSQRIINELNYNINQHFKLKSDLNLSENMFGYLFGVTKLRLINDLLDPGTKVFINIGRLSEQKGHDILIQSFAKIHELHSNTKLVIVAPHGPLKKETIQWIKESGCADSIYLLGSMDNPYALMKYVDAMIFTSRYEGLGLVVFEALAINVPVITVDLPETISVLEKDNAIVVKQSVEDIFDGLKVFMNEDDYEMKPFNFKKWDEKSLKEFEDIF